MGFTRQQIYGIILLIFTPIVGYLLYTFGVIQDIMWFIDEIAVIVIGAMIVTGITLLYTGRSKKDTIFKGEKVALLTHPEPQKSWFSKHRFYVKKERKSDFWIVVITLALFGAIMIIIPLNVPTVPLSPEATTIYITVRISMIGVGIFLLSLFVWLSANELYALWESRKQLIDFRKNAYLKLTKDFDNAFQAVQEVSDTDLKIAMLKDLREPLVKFCNTYEWSQVNDRIESILNDIIPEKISDEPDKQQRQMYVQFLRIIVNRFSENTVSMINKKWRKELEKIYADPEYSPDFVSDVLLLLQELDGYSLEYLIKLVDDATIRWTNLKFTALQDFILFSELKKRDEAAYDKILHYMLLKITDAKRNNEDVVFERLRTLRNIAKKIS